MTLPDRLSGLLHERAYPHPCGEIELIETHISWVILTGNYAYKLKKPVRFNFLDFSTLALREYFCGEELRCNRAFAPDLYLDVVAVVPGEDGIGLQSAPTGEVLEWAVKMRQFDPELGLDRMLARGELGPEQLHEFGSRLAGLHGALPVHRGRPEEVVTRVFGPVEDNFSEIGGTGLATIHQAELEDALEASRKLGESLRHRFDLRMTGGAIRECHGDLHLSNLALIEGVVTAFDCLEFNENLRWIDTMSDVAFLFMDCHCRDQIALAYGFLDGYLDASGDYAGAGLLHYFAAYRSVVRAKVAALRWVQTTDEEQAARFLEHLNWARSWLRRPTGTLVLTCGLSGSGKSYLAGKLVGNLPAVRVRSDVARKALAGLTALDDSRSPIDGGLYAAEQSDRTFDYLLEVASGLLRAGEHVIVDATFIERSRRDRFADLARSIGAPLHILYCAAPLAVLKQRLTARSAAGRDPSEAGVEVLELQLDRFEPPAADEAVIPVDGTAELTASVVDSIVERLLS